MKSGSDGGEPSDPVILQWEVRGVGGEPAEQVQRFGGLSIGITTTDASMAPGRRHFFSVCVGAREPCRPIPGAERHLLQPVLARRTVHSLRKRCGSLDMNPLRWNSLVYCCGRCPEPRSR